MFKYLNFGLIPLRLRDLLLFTAKVKWSLLTDTKPKRHRYINVICVDRTLLWMIRWPHFRKDVFSVMGLALFLAPAKAISTHPCFMDDTTLFRD